MIGKYDPESIRNLKDEVGSLYVSGSGTLVHALLRDGLVDQLHLCMFPHARGGGPRLFPDGVPPSDFERVIADVYENGVLYLSYRPSTWSVTALLTQVLGTGRDRQQADGS